MVRLSDEFYLVDQTNKQRKISVEYCRGCGDRYYFSGIYGTEFQDIREKYTKDKILNFAQVHNLEIEEVEWC